MFWRGSGRRKSAVRSLFSFMAAFLPCIVWAADGDVLWTRTLYGGQPDGFGSVAVGSSGEVYAAGYTRSAASGMDGMIVRYSPAGVTEWIDVWGVGSAADEGLDVTRAPDGSVLVVGYT